MSAIHLTLAVIGGAMLGILFMSLMFMARHNTEEQINLLNELEINGLSLTRVEDQHGVFWMCSHGTPRATIGDVSPSPSLAITSALITISEQNG